MDSIFLYVTYPVKKQHFFITFNSRFWSIYPLVLSLAFSYFEISLLTLASTCKRCIFLRNFETYFFGKINYSLLALVVPHYPPATSPIRNSQNHSFGELLLLPTKLRERGMKMAREKVCGIIFFTPTQVCIWLF